MDLYAAICVVANVLNRLDVSALAARKLTRRRFVFGGTASENLCATAPASLRYQIADVSGPAVVAEAGSSS